MYRIVSLLFACSLLAHSAAAQSATQAAPPSADASSQFPSEPSRDEGDTGKALYVEGHGGLGSTSDVTATFGDIEFGGRLSKHVSAFGAYGLYRNLQPSAIQSHVDIAVNQMAQRHISVNGEARDPSQYALGGVRVEKAMPLRITPYGLVGVGFAHSTPSARFAYTGGTPTISGATASAGQDATDDVLSSGVFIGDSSYAVMVRWGGGIRIPVRSSFFIDAAYTGSRILASSPVTVQGVRFGVAFRF